LVPPSFDKGKQLRSIYAWGSKTQEFVTPQDWDCWLGQRSQHHASYLLLLIKINDHIFPVSVFILNLFFSRKANENTGSFFFFVNAVIGFTK
jgi:hypothetical protein